MCISKVEHPKCKMLNRNTIGREVVSAVTKARCERRLVCGLLPSLNYLDDNPEDALLCLLTRSEEAGSHMQTVLLQAYCYENYIPVIQVDSSETLASICGISFQRKHKSEECFCVVIARDVTVPLNVDENPPRSPSEQILTDFYDCTLKEFPQPVIQLPAIVT